MTIWGALAGGLVGTVVLTSGLRFAQELGWTRMDIRIESHVSQLEIIVSSNIAIITPNDVSPEL